MPLMLFPGVQTPAFSSFPSPFEQHVCRDRLGRSITYYISKDKGRLPLVLLITGSGTQSIWTVRDGKLFGGLQNLLRQVADGKTRIMIVEKPGVPFAFAPPQPGTAEGAPNEYLREHTLTRWAEANEAALRDAWHRSDVDRARTLVVGHSEGGIVAARIAAEQRRVTHLGLLASGGPNQLYDLSMLMNDRSSVFETWKQISQDPNSTTKFAWGHPYRRWSSFLASSTQEEAFKSKTSVFIAQGTNDQSVLPTTADLLYAELLARGRSVVYEKVEDADHGFRKPSDKSPIEGFRSVLEKVLRWFTDPSVNH